MGLKCDELAGEKAKSVILGWFTVFEPSEIELGSGSPPSTGCSMEGSSWSGVESGVLSFAASC